MSVISAIYWIDWINLIKVSITLYIIKFYYNYYTRKSPLPGPFPLPLICNFHQVGLTPAQYAIDHNEFGDIFEIWIGQTRCIVLSNSSLIDQIYVPSIKANKFFQRIMIPHFNGKGLIFNNDISTWKRNRKFIIRSLKSIKFVKNFTFLVQLLFNENESKWDQYDNKLNFAKWAKCFVTDITLQTITSKSSYCLNAYLFEAENNDLIKSTEIKKTLKFKEAAKIFLLTATYRAFTPEILIKCVSGFYNLNKKYEKNTKWLTENILDFIRNRRTWLNKVQNDESVSSLLEILLTLNILRDPEFDNCYETDVSLTDKEICSIITEVFLATIDSVRIKLYNAYI
jgi:hypothetical protein